MIDMQERLQSSHWLVPRTKQKLPCFRNACKWSEEKWRTVNFSDESESNLLGSDGRRWYVRRGAGETMSPKCIERSVKFGGGSVVVWGGGMIPAGALVRLHGRVNAAVDKELVKQHGLPVL